MLRIISRFSTENFPFKRANSRSILEAGFVCFRIARNWSTTKHKALRSTAPTWQSSEHWGKNMSSWCRFGLTLITFNLPHRCLSVYPSIETMTSNATFKPQIKALSSFRGRDGTYPFWGPKIFNHGTGYQLQRCFQVASLAQYHYYPAAPELFHVYMRNLSDGSKYIWSLYKL